MARYDDGQLAIAFLTADDFSEAEAEESYSEGIIDHLRAVEGTKVAALVREVLAEDRRGQKKVSLRATGDDVDVSAIARAHGGGGHRRAAGFTTGLSIPDLVAELRGAARRPAVGPAPDEPDPRLRRQPVSPIDGLILADKPAGITSHDMVARARHALGRRRVGHAGTLDPFATGLLILLVGRATRVQRYLMAQPKTYEVVVRFGATSTTGDPRAWSPQTGILPASRSRCRPARCSQRPPAHSAVKVDGERAYARARRGEERRARRARPIDVHEFTTLWEDGDRAGLRIVCGSGTYVRSLVADLGDAYCLELRRTAIGPFGVDGAWPGVGHVEVTGMEAGLGRIMPVVALGGDDARAATHGRAVPVADGALERVGGSAWDHALLVDGSGPIAVAEAREGGLLKPVVGFRA